MNEAEFQEMVEASWRRRLTPDEESQLQAWLALHPEHQAEWESESHLNQALDQLPKVAVSSNFTALVLQAARREASRPAPRPWWKPAVSWLVPRPATGLAWAALLMCVTWFGRHQAQLHSRERHAQDLTVLACAAVLPEPQVLAMDFETLRRLPEVEDDELFAVLRETAANR